jgi:hypothetical protein
MAKKKTFAVICDGYGLLLLLQVNSNSAVVSTSSCGFESPSNSLASSQRTQAPVSTTALPTQFDYEFRITVVLLFMNIQEVVEQHNCCCHKQASAVVGLCNGIELSENLNVFQSDA